MAVVWDTVLDSDILATGTYGGYEKYGRESVPIPVSHQHHHHFHYPSGVYHTLGNLAGGAKDQTVTKGDFFSWTPDSDIRETQIAYHIEIEVPGVSDKKAIQIVWLSPTRLQIEGTALRLDLIRGREGDGDPIGKSHPAPAPNKGTNGVSEKSDVDVKNDRDGGPCKRCADTENEMTTILIHGERKIGAWLRSFVLPTGCDMTTLKAKLDAGLLHISVFKKKDFVADGTKTVEIE